MHLIRTGSLAFAGLFVPALAQAATFHVDDIQDFGLSPGAEMCQCLSTNDTCTLRAAVETANDCAGDDIIVLQEGGVYTLTINGPGEDKAVTGDLDVVENLVVQAGEGDTVDANWIVGMTDRIFDVHFGAHLTLDGLIVRNGETQPGERGGCIRAQHAGLELRNTSVQICESAVDGGGIWAHDTEVVLVGSQVSQSRALRGLGGGIYADEKPIAFFDSALLSNIAYDGGGLFVGPGAFLTLENTEVNSNSATRGGGGMWVQEDASAVNLEMVANTAEYAGGALVYRADLIVSGLNARANNSARDGAAFYGHQNSRIEIDHGAITSNTASGNGGAFYSFSLVYLYNTSIYDNTAVAGSAIYNIYGGFAYANNVSIVANVPSAGRGIEANIVRLQNSIVESNGFDCNPGVTSLGYVVSPNPTCLAGGAPGNFNGFANATPLVTPSGSTVLTISSTSAAYNAGDNASCESDDQLYTARPQGVACDIGAYELVP